MPHIPFSFLCMTRMQTRDTRTLVHAHTLRPVTSIAAPLVMCRSEPCQRQNRAMSHSQQRFTYHVDFGHHVYAGYVYVHAHSHRCTCQGGGENRR